MQKENCRNSFSELSLDFLHRSTSLHLQNFFTVFDIVVRTSLALSLLFVVAGFNEERL